MSPEVNNTGGATNPGTDGEVTQVQKESVEEQNENQFPVDSNDNDNNEGLLTKSPSVNSEEQDKKEQEDPKVKGQGPSSPEKTCPESDIKGKDGDNEMKENDNDNDEIEFICEIQKAQVPWNQVVFKHSWRFAVAADIKDINIWDETFKKNVLLGARQLMEDDFRNNSFLTWLKVEEKLVVTESGIGHNMRCYVDPQNQRYSVEFL